MGNLRSGSHWKAPLQMLIVGLLLIGAEAYWEAGSDAAQFAIQGSLKKLLIQVPAGIVACWLATRFIEFDFGSLGNIALKIAAISVLAEGVACWVPSEFFTFLPLAAELAVMLVGFFWLFELGKWETYLIVLLNFAVLFGAHFILKNYLSELPRAYGTRPTAKAKRQAAPARRPVTPREDLIKIQ